MGKFVIKLSGTGYSYSLKAGNGETIAVSSRNQSDISAVKAIIADIINYAPEAPVEDQTAANYQPAGGAKFEIYKDKAEQFRFRLKNAKGEILGVSEGYIKKDSCKNGINSVRRNAVNSPVIEPEG